MRSQRRFWDFGHQQQYVVEPTGEKRKPNEHQVSKHTFQENTNLGDNFRIRLQFQQTFRESRGMCLVVRFSKYADCTSQGDLHVWWLQLTLCKVSGELEVPCNIVRLFFDNTSPFEFN
jgi:hypothetical protein